MAEVAPRLAGWSGFPSTLLGRPIWCVTSTPSAIPSPASRARAGARAARHDALGLLDIGDAVARRFFGSTCRQPAQCQRSSHQFEKSSPVERAGRRGGKPRKLLRQIAPQRPLRANANRTCPRCPARRRRSPARSSGALTGGTPSNRRGSPDGYDIGAERSPDCVSALRCQSGSNTASCGRRCGRSMVAIQAPAHVERLGLARHRHGANRAVALGAADAFGDMDAVVEKDVVGERIDARPPDILVLGQALAHRRQHRRRGPELRMAGHAGLGRRHAGIARELDRGMTHRQSIPSPPTWCLWLKGTGCGGMKFMSVA